MKRYCISPVTGTGTITDPYRPTVAGLSGVNSAAVIPTNSNGTPKWRFALCVVATTGNLAGVLGVSNLYALPDYALDGRMDGMESGARTGMVQSVHAYDLDGAGRRIDMSGFGDADSYRSVLAGIGQQLDSGFNLNQFDVAEPTP